MSFPGMCVHCAQPAGESMRLSSRQERKVREVDVPLCADCAAALRRTSADEERAIKLGRLLLAVIFMATVVLGLLLSSSGMALWLRLVLALLAGLIVAAIVRGLWQIVVRRAAPEKKKEIRHSASLETFSWRTVTFDFANDAFAGRFEELNEALLVDGVEGGQ